MLNKKLSTNPQIKEPKKAPPKSSKNPIKVRSKIYFKNFDNCKIIKKLNKKLTIIETTISALSSRLIGIFSINKIKI